MQHPVRADDLLLRPWPAPVERAHSAAGLFDDRHERRIVPWRESRIDRCIHGTFGYEHVLPEVADRPRMPTAGSTVTKSRPYIADSDASARLDTLETRISSPSLNAPAPQQPTSGAPALGPTRRRKRRRLPARAPPGWPRQERRARSSSSRRWVDHPSDRTPAAPVFFTENAVIGTALGDPPAKRALDRPVGVGHRRQVRLCLDTQVHRLEARQAQRVGEVSKLESEGEVRRRDPSNPSGAPSTGRCDMTSRRRRIVSERRFTCA